jgi:hypothetical protein
MFILYNKKSFNFHINYILDRITFKHIYNVKSRGKYPFLLHLIQLHSPVWHVVQYYEPQKWIGFQEFHTKHLPKK